MDGESLMPIIYGKGSRKDKEVYSELYHNEKYYRLTSMIGETWKLIYNAELQEFELFDIKNDPSEKNNLIYIKTKEGNELKKKLLDWIMIKKEQRVAVSKVEMNKETIQQLKSLGYMQ